MPGLEELSIYAINVRFDLDTDEYRLFNHDWPVGDRLIKHDADMFPLDRSRDWTRYQDEEQAEEAAVKLQRYLDKKPEPKAPKKNGSKKKR